MKSSESASSGRWSVKRNNAIKSAWMTGCREKAHGSATNLGKMKGKPNVTEKRPC